MLQQTDVIYADYLGRILNVQQAADSKQIK